jgi:hypothetical protein
MQHALSIRVDATNPDHHLWNNHGIWWIHYTLLEGGLRQHRIRRSLQTRDRAQARAIRDVLFARLGRNTSEPRTFLQQKGA